MPRRPDEIRLEAADGGAFTKFSRLQIVNDLLAPNEATFELGDDDSFSELADDIEAGKEFTVKLNNRPRMTGRVEVRQVPGDANQGVTISLTVRTKTSDARVASAPASVKVENTTIKDFVLACYEPLGMTESDFHFGDFTARNLMTGAAKNAKPLKLEPLKVDQAKVNPPETIYQAVERHLKRFGAMQWDSPDGRIMIGAPDDTQPPEYRLLCRKGGQGNNVTRFRKIQDLTDSPLTVEVFGTTQGKITKKSQLKYSAENPLLREIADRAAGHFRRRVIVPAQSSQNAVQVEKMATRELSARRRREDAWEITVDGWTYWNGDNQTPWANNTTADVDIQMAGGPVGRYLIVRTDLQASTDHAITCKLQMVAPGIWVI